MLTKCFSNSIRHGACSSAQPLSVKNLFIIWSTNSTEYYAGLHFCWPCLCFKIEHHRHCPEKNQKHNLKKQQCLYDAISCLFSGNIFFFIMVWTPVNQRMLLKSSWLKRPVCKSQFTSSYTSHHCVSKKRWSLKCTGSVIQERFLFFVFFWLFFCFFLRRQWEINISAILSKE